MRLRSLPFFLITSLSLLASAPWAHAATPPDQYHFDSFFPLLKFIPPPRLKVYEHLDQSRTYEHTRLNIISQVTSCENSSDCIAEFQHCSDSGCGPTQTGHGTCRQSDPDEPGTCEYLQNPTCTAQVGSTDYSRPNEISYPKEQNEWQRFDYIGSNNSISWGTHNLALSLCDRAELQLIALTQANQTKRTLDQTAEWPLGWVDWEYKTVSGQTLLEIWNHLGGLQGIGQALTDAHDTFLVSGGDNVVDVSESRQQLCQQVSTQIHSPAIRALLESPIYPPAESKGFARCSICAEGICLSSAAGEALYTDLSIRASLAAALNDLFMTYPLEEARTTLQQAIEHNPLLPYTQIATKDAVPSHLTIILHPQVAGLPEPFTLAALGHIFDYQELMNKYGYKLMEQPTAVKGGAFVTSIGQTLINFAYGVVSLFVDLSSHLITIPEPMAQSILELQNPVYRTRDTSDELQKDSYESLSTLIDSTRELYVGKPLDAGESRRRLAYLTCQDPDYSAPQETIIESYALGTRIGCNKDTDTTTTSVCDGQEFTKITGDLATPTSDKAIQIFGSMRGFLTPELLKIYATAGEITGVPCEILAGIHYIEADLNPTGSLVSGRPLGTPEPDAGGKVFNTLLDTAIYAGTELKAKVGGNLASVSDYVTALSRYNGGGNANCQAGYPWPIPYTGCPKTDEGEDDPYSVNYLDARHSTMYLLYCADLTACEPQVFERDGSYTFALTMYQQMTGVNL